MAEDILGKAEAAGETTNDDAESGDTQDDEEATADVVSLDAFRKKAD